MHSKIIQHHSKLCLCSSAELVDNSSAYHCHLGSCCSAFHGPKSQSLMEIFLVVHWQRSSYLFVCTWKSCLSYRKILQLLLFALDPQIHGNFFRWTKLVNKVQVANEQLHKLLRSSLPGNFSSITFIISAGQGITKNWWHDSPPGWIFFYWAALWNPS